VILIEESQVKRRVIVWAIIGYVIGVLAGVGTTTYMMKNDLAKANATAEQYTQQLRECEAKLDKR